MPDDQLDDVAREARRAAVQAVARAKAVLGADAHRLRSSCGSARGMRADLGLRRPRGADDEVVYEVKTMAFSKSGYRVRAHNGGRSWADHRARQAVRERADQAAKLDEGLFRGAPDRPMASALEGKGGVRALVVGGCCELNTTAHELLVDIGSEIGAYNAAESGESLAECIALDIHRVRQRLAVQIWRDYQDHLNARIRFADPDEDDKRRHEEEARVDTEEQELAARRMFNEAYLQRMGRPQAFGLG